VVQALNLKKVILIGHSMGGLVVVEAARLLPSRSSDRSVDTLLNVEQKFTREQFELFMAPMRQNFKKATEDFLRNWMFTPKSDPALVEKIVIRWLPLTPDSPGCLGKYV